jgi:hypothetical protein
LGLDRAGGQSGSDSNRGEEGAQRAEFDDIEESVEK